MGAVVRIRYSLDNPESCWSTPRGVSISPYKSGAYSLPDRDSDLAVAVKVLEGILHTVSRRLDAAQRLPDRMREIERTVSTLFALLFVRREGGRKAVLNVVDDHEERLRALENRREVTTGSDCAGPGLAKTEPETREIRDTEPDITPMAAIRRGGAR